MCLFGWNIAGVEGVEVHATHDSNVIYVLGNSI